MGDPYLLHTDVMDPARAQALQATLGITPMLGAGDDLPPFFHQLYFWTALTPNRLGRDGHPARGEGVVPDLGLPRRMWAGGRLEFLHPIRLGQDAQSETRSLRAEQKTGRSGALGLVTLGIEIWQHNVLCLREERDLIYREDADPAASKPEPPQTSKKADTETPLNFSTTQLFRYSALTFNGHRIHYDLDYARDIEGYDGLVVHGPLLAQHLILKATEELGPLARFEFRATAPLMDWETATACRAGTDLWIEGPEGRLCMTATARPA